MTGSPEKHGRLLVYEFIFSQQSYLVDPLMLSIAREIYDNPSPLLFSHWGNESCFKMIQNNNQK